MKEQTTLKLLLDEFFQRLAAPGAIVLRDTRFPDAPKKIKVAIGMRRSGKTYFLYYYIQKLLNEGIDKNCILYLNFEDDRLSPLNGQKLARLLDAFFELYPENASRKCYFFLDEIQNVDEWALVIRRFYDTRNVEIFLTGSSAKLLSKEIATSLRGRSLATEIWPYSFSEYLRAKGIVLSSDEKAQEKRALLFRQYLSEGGFPEIVSLDSPLQKQVLQEYLDVTLYRDLIERHGIKNASLLRYMVVSMTHTIGKPFTIHKFFNDLRSQGYQIGKDSLYDYASHLEDAFLIFSVPLFNTSIRRVQSNPKKIYSIDPGMVRAVTLEYKDWLGRLFENVVYLDLRRLGCTVYYYLTKDRYEIDFVVQTPNHTIKVFQVVWDCTDPKTLDRERRALDQAMLELRCDGELITLDTYLSGGIRLD